MSAPPPPIDAAHFCALPLVRRAYMAAVCGLAMFIVTLVVLREPFRGYLAEVHLNGPAIEGLDLKAAARWLKNVDSQVAVVTTVAGEISPRPQIRMTYVAARPTPATMRLDELASRWLYRYLPERLQDYRRTALAELRAAAALAHEGEDAARDRLEAARQAQLASLRAPVLADNSEGSAADVPRESSQRTSQQERLEARQLELSQLLARFTDEHPQVVSLRSQIAALQREMAQAPAAATQSRVGPELRPAPSGIAGRFVSTTAPVRPSAQSDASTLVNSALQELAQASRQRQAAEQHLNDLVQELGSQPTAAEWSAEPARIVTRLGGTPRSITLALGGLLASIAALVLFRTSAAAVEPAKIETLDELADSLPLPMIGSAAHLRATAARVRTRLFTPARVRLIVHLSEGVIAAAVAACLFAIAIEPSLARQVLADPFGTLSEMIGRLTGV